MSAKWGFVRARLSLGVALALAVSLLSAVAPPPAHAANAACVLGTDYTRTTSGGYTYIKFINTAATCDWTVPSWVTQAAVAIVGGGGSGGYGNQGNGHPDQGSHHLVRGSRHRRDQVQGDSQPERHARLQRLPDGRVRRCAGVLRAFRARRSQGLLLGRVEDLQRW